MPMGRRSRDAAIGAGVAPVAATLFIWATFFWNSDRGTLVYFVFVGLYALPWIALLAWVRSRVTESRASA